MNAALILSKNFKALFNGEIKSVGTGSYRGVLNNRTDENIFTDVDGNNYKSMATETTSTTSTTVLHNIGYEVSRQINSLFVSGLFCGTGGSNITDASYSADESVSATITASPQYSPSLTKAIITITNTSDAPITFNQVHHRSAATLSTSTTGDSPSSKSVLWWTVVFDEDVVVAPNTSFTFNIKL